MINPWFKFYGSEFLSDQKILQLTGNERSCWVTLLCLAGQTKDGVVKFLSEKQLLLMSGVSEDIRVLQKFEELQMIDVSNGNVTVKNWLKRQLSESINRVREFRMKQKSNGDVTTEKNRIEKKREEDIELPNWLDKKTWEDWIEYRIEKKKKLTPISIKQQLKFLAEHSRDHIKIIEKSIQNGWVGLFPLDNGKTGYTGNEYMRDKKKVSDRMDEINYQDRVKRDNMVTALANKFKV